MPDEHDNVADFALARQRQRQAEAERKKEDGAFTHHDVALAMREDLAVGSHRPVYVNGAFHLPTADGLWRPESHQRLQVLIAEAYGGRKGVCKQSEFRQAAEHMANVCTDDQFFEEAPVGVVTPQGFHRLGDDGAVVTEPLTLADRQVFALPFAPEFEAECPNLDRVLAEAFAGDAEAEQTSAWWEAVGATIFGLMPQLQVVVLMLGRERSGKSLLQKVLERGFPLEAVCAVSPAAWSSDYFLASLAGKRINLVGELHDESPIPGAAFKNVTGGNLVTGRHPTHRPFTFRPMVAHWFASNVLPGTTDRGEAFYRRWVVLRFRNSVPVDQVDPGLFDKIVAEEMPAMLAQAFLGAERVARSGRITASQAHAGVMAKWRQAANPIEQFLADDEVVALDPAEREHSTAEVFAAYRRWSAQCGFRNPFGRNHFLELLASTGATRGVAVKRVDSRNVVVGLRLLWIGASNESAAFHCS